MMSIDLTNNAKRGGVWVLAKYLMTDFLNLNEAEKEKTRVPTKIVIDRDGGLDLIEVRDDIPELKCYREGQVELKDAGDMVGIIIDGNPFVVLDFEKGSEEAKEKYINLFLDANGISEKELEKYTAPEIRYILPKVGIVPKTADYLLNQ
jgi:hypothetical protein